MFHNEIRVPLGFFFLQLHERLVFRLATAQSSIALISNRINCNQHRRQHREPASEKCAYFSRFKPSPVVHIAISELQRSKSTCFFFFWLFLYFLFFSIIHSYTLSHTHSTFQQIQRIGRDKNIIGMGNRTTEDGTATTKGESCLH